MAGRIASVPSTAETRGKSIEGATLASVLGQLRAALLLEGGAAQNVNRRDGVEPRTAGDASAGDDDLGIALGAGTRLVGRRQLRRVAARGGRGGTLLGLARRGSRLPEGGGAERQGGDGNGGANQERNVAHAKFPFQ